MPTTWDALGILLFFIVPGFVGDRLLSLASARIKRDTTEIVIGSLVWSIVNYAICSPLVVWLIRTNYIAKNPYEAGLLWGSVVLIAPICEALFLSKFVGVDRISGAYRFLGLKIHPIPRSWDYVFSRGVEYLVRATLSDGTQIGGLWGPNSFASSYPTDEDIYLELLWGLGENGEFLAPVPLSAGALLKRSDIRYVEFFEVRKQELTSNE